MAPVLTQVLLLYKMNVEPTGVQEEVYSVPGNGLQGPSWCPVAAEPGP